MIMLVSGFLLVLIGIWAMLTRKNIIRIIIGFSILDTGIHLIIVAVGFVKGGTAPILDNALLRVPTSVDLSAAVSRVVDPLPSALVLTAIVIGLAVTALLLSFAIRLHKYGRSLDIDVYEEQKW